MTHDISPLFLAATFTLGLAAIHKAREYANAIFSVLIFLALLLGTLLLIQVLGRVESNSPPDPQETSDRTYGME